MAFFLGYALLDALTHLIEFLKHRIEVLFCHIGMKLEFDFELYKHLGL